MGKAKELTGMPVEELHAKLGELIANDMGDSVVRFAFNSGDYWKTIITNPVEDVELRKVEWTDYHRTFKLVDQEEDFEDDDEEAEDESEEDSYIRSKRQQVIVIT